MQVASCSGFALLVTAALLGACTARLGSESDGVQDTGRAAGAGSEQGGRLPRGGALRRLAIREIENSLDTLFPEIATTRRRFPAQSFELFDNDEAHNDAGLSFLENAAVVMTSVVAEARQTPEVWSRVQTCAPGLDPAECFGTFYDHWAPLVLRRPADPSERARIAALAELELGSLDDGLAVALEALLRHAEFLFRVELGDSDQEVRRLTQAQALNRLAFWLWGEAPDAALIAQASDLDLHDHAVRGELARVMLNDARARRQVFDYHAQWLGFSGMDRKGLGAALWQESEALVGRVVFDEAAPYGELFTLRETYVTPALADHYGLEPQDAAGWVSLAGSERSGILGHGSFLSSFSNVGDTSPSKRGKSVHNRLLCRNIELPSSLDVDVDATPGEAECRVDFLKEVHAGGSCANCHDALDGVGFGLETFDRLGARRDHELDKPDCPLDGRGHLDGKPFIGPEGLAERLVEHEEFAPCLATQLLRFYSGADVRRDQRAQTWRDDLLDEYRDGGEQFLDLMLGVVLSPEFVLVAPR
jgi:hypothetical protein